MYNIHLIFSHPKAIETYKLCTNLFIMPSFLEYDKFILRDYKPHLISYIYIY